jgi:hypothetical protein
MKDKDALLLWESYMESSKPDFADIDKDGDKKESMKKAAKDKEEDTETVEETDHSNLRAARTDEENAAADKEEADEKKDDDKDEKHTKTDTLAEAAMPEDDVFSAIEMAEGGDYRGAIETAVSAIANHMLNDIEHTGNGPLDEAETADVWNIKDGIKIAIEDLFGGANAEAYDALTKNLRNAFHKSNKEPVEGPGGFIDDPRAPGGALDPNMDQYR